MHSEKIVPRQALRDIERKGKVVVIKLEYKYQILIGKISRFFKFVTENPRLKQYMTENIIGTT